MINNAGDPRLNKPSEWFCAKCGHSEIEHNLEFGTCEYGYCDCDGFEDKEDE